MQYPASLNDEFTFGKYRGKTLKEVIEKEPTYIEWCMSEITDFLMDDEAYDYYNLELEDSTGYRDEYDNCYPYEFTN